MGYQEGQHKNFSQADKDKSDPQSKRISAEFLQQIDPQYHLDIPTDEQPEMYSKYDFEIGYGAMSYTVETEQKLRWITNDGTFRVASDNFPNGVCYQTVDVSGRKWSSIANTFIMFNGTFDTLCMTEMSNVLSAPVGRKNTSRGTKKEPFFNVPKELFTFYILQGGEWKLV